MKPQYWKIHYIWNFLTLDYTLDTKLKFKVKRLLFTKAVTVFHSCPGGPRVLTGLTGELTTIYRLVTSISSPPTLIFWAILCLLEINVSTLLIPTLPLLTVKTRIRLVDQWKNQKKPPGHIAAVLERVSKKETEHMSGNRPDGRLKFSSDLFQEDRIIFLKGNFMWPQNSYRTQEMVEKKFRRNPDFYILP